jgi:hypothetical protein
MKSTLTRRALVASTAAMPAAAALDLPATAGTADAELRQLWSKYLDHVAEYEAADAKHTAAREPFNAQLDAEFPPDRGTMDSQTWDAHKLRWEALWDQLGLEPLFRAWNETSERVRGIVAEIQQARAESLFGVGIKLGALQMQAPEEEDWRCAVQATLADIDRLLGSDFSARVAKLIGEDEDEGKGDAEEAT